MEEVLVVKKVPETVLVSGVTNVWVPWRASVMVWVLEGMWEGELESMMAGVLVDVSLWDAKLDANSESVMEWVMK
jgi:hypothetical protein